jgi:hypothetical protein
MYNYRVSIGTLSRKNLAQGVRFRMRSRFVDRIIDLNAEPFVPAGWFIIRHLKGGHFRWDPNAIELYLSPIQREGGIIEGDTLFPWLANKNVLNANMLDYVLARPRLIPDELRSDEKGNLRFIFFWGTLYRDENGFRRVRFLYRNRFKWAGGVSFLGSEWNGSDPAAVLKSSFEVSKSFPEVDPNSVSSQVYYFRSGDLK